MSFYVDIDRYHDDRSWWRWAWELREGDEDRQFSVSERAVATDGVAHTRVGAMRAARRAKRRVIRRRGRYLEKNPPSLYRDRFSALGWKHIAQAVLDAREHVDVDVTA